MGYISVGHGGLKLPAHKILSHLHTYETTMHSIERKQIKVLF